MTALRKHLVQVSEFHKVLDRGIWAKVALDSYTDTITEAHSKLLVELDQAGRCNGLSGQALSDFIADHIGTVCPIDTINQSDFPALIKAALVANHTKG